MLRKTFVDDIPQLRDEIILLGSRGEPSLVDSMDPLQKQDLIETDKRASLKGPPHVTGDRPRQTSADAASVAAPPSLRRVLLSEGARFEDFTDYQVNYLNYRTGWLIPSTEVWVGNELAFVSTPSAVRATSSIPSGASSRTSATARPSAPTSMRGPFTSPSPATRRSTPASKATTLCASARATAAAREGRVRGRCGRRLVAQPRLQRSRRALLDGAFELLRSGDHITAFCTLPTAYNEACCTRGLDDLIAGRAGRKSFSPWRSWPTTPEKTREAFEAVLRYNDFVRGYCARTGHCSSTSSRCGAPRPRQRR